MAYGMPERERGVSRNGSAKNRKPVKLNLKRLIISAAVFAFSVYFVCMTFGQQRVLNAKSREIDELNTKIAAASDETDALKSEFESVNEPEYLEQMAREKLGLIQPNERVYIDVSGGN